MFRICLIEVDHFRKNVKTRRIHCTLPFFAFIPSTIAYIARESKSCRQPPTTIQTRTVFSSRAKENSNTRAKKLARKHNINVYRRRPRRPPLRRVESEGVGVTSSIRPIFMPERAKARRADWAPGPGVLVPLPVTIN